MNHEPLSEEEAKRVQYLIQTGKLSGHAAEEAIGRLVATIEDLHIQLEEERRPRLRQQHQEQFESLWRQCVDRTQDQADFLSAKDKRLVALINAKHVLIGVMATVDNAIAMAKKLQELGEEP